MAGKKAKTKKPSKGTVPLVRKGEVENSTSRGEAPVLGAYSPSDESSQNNLLTGPTDDAIGSFPAHQTSSGSGVRRAAGSGVRAVWAENGTREGGSPASSSADPRPTSGPAGSREGEWRRKPQGERERDKRDTGEREREKDKGPGDECHNGERLGRSPFVRLSSEKEWSWLSYSTKQFRAFAQEFPPTLDIGADEVGHVTCDHDDLDAACPPPVLLSFLFAVTALSMDFFRDVVLC